MMRFTLAVSTIALAIACAGRLDAQTNALRLSTRVVSPDAPTTVTLAVDGIAAVPIGGVQFGIALPAGVDFVAFEDRTDSEFVGVDSGTDFVTVGLLFSTSGIEERGPDFFDFGRLTLGVPALTAGTTLEIPLAPGLGSPPITVRLNVCTPSG